jgi:hypothetical protein
LTADFERVVDLVPVDRVSPDFVAYLRFTLKERSLNSEFLILLQNHNSRFATRHLIGYNDQNWRCGTDLKSREKSRNVLG